MKNTKKHMRFPSWLPHIGARYSLLLYFFINMVYNLSLMLCSDLYLEVQCCVVCDK